MMFYEYHGMKSGIFDGMAWDLILYLQPAQKDLWFWGLNCVGFLYHYDE